MSLLVCPHCGHHLDAAAAACPDCGNEMKNGTLLQSGSPAVPAEVSGWSIEKTPPDLLAWARQTFSEDEIVAGEREIEQTGGVRFEDFIGEIERRVRSE